MNGQLGGHPPDWRSILAGVRGERCLPEMGWTALVGLECEALESRGISENYAINALPSLCPSASRAREY